MKNTSPVAAPNSFAKPQMNYTALEAAYELAGELWGPGSCLASPVLAWCGKDVDLAWGRVIKWLLAAGGLFVLLLRCAVGYPCGKTVKPNTSTRGERTELFFIWLELFQCVQPSVVLL